MISDRVTLLRTFYYSCLRLYVVYSDRERGREKKREREKERERKKKEQCRNYRRKI